VRSNYAVAVVGIFFSHGLYKRKETRGSAKMPGARSKAHKLLADRYAKEGNAHKATAHYKRAFEYELR
jgi:hypothetical protein